ncbi:hypothetical protein pb186bvf_018314 [Paramecium bursaria]
MDKHQFKRVKERTVKDAYESVAKWRDYFENGYIDQAGIRKKATLQDAAILVGIPKKTLEDYYQLLKKVQQYGSLNDLMDKKMGDLRKILKSDCQDQIQSQTVYQEEDMDQVDYVEQNIDHQYYQPQYECDLFLNLDPQDNYYQDYDTFTLQVVDSKQELPIEKMEKTQISDENLIDLLQEFSFLDIDELKEEFKEEQQSKKKDDKFQQDEWENQSISDCETNESDY